MKQKFPAYSFVHVCKNMPDYMKHFDSNFKGIVVGTYSQLFGGKNIKDYAIYKIDKGMIVQEIAWYEEDQLSLLGKQDYISAQEMAEQYRFNPPNAKYSWDGKNNKFIVNYIRG